jgi:hypothetical protein
MNDWISTDSMLPAFGKRVLLAYSGFQDDGKGGNKQVHTYTVGELHREEGWISDEGMIDDSGQFDADVEPEWWMPIQQAPPF